MARLASLERALFYPSPPEVVWTLQEDVFRGTPQGRLLDPCAGKGEAAATLARGWGIESYGVELNSERAKLAAARMTCVRAGSYHQLPEETCKESFSILFENPPYADGESADGVRTRQEVQFLIDTVPYLKKGGLLIYIPPRHILGDGFFRETMRRCFRDARVYRFPGETYDRFKQVVVIAIRDESQHWYRGEFPWDEKSELPELGSEPYPVSLDQVTADDLRPMTPDLFRLYGIAPELMCPSYDEAAPTGAYATPQWAALTGVGHDEYAIRPLLPLRTGHQAMLLAAGCLDGAQLADGTLVKGSSEKIITEREDAEAEKRYETERIVSRLSTLDLATGELRTIKTDEDPEGTRAWFAANGLTLAQAVKERFPPVFDGDTTDWDFSHLRSPGRLPGRAEGEILPAQKSAAAAVRVCWRTRRAAVISGEMGTGKTTMGILACALAGFSKVVVMCPGHLVRKWLREVMAITRWPAMTAQTVSEVDAFFDDPDCRFLIISKEYAKLGARWEHRYSRAKIREKRERRKPTGRTVWEGYRQVPEYEKVTEIETVEVLTCPDCGEILTTGVGRLVPESFKDEKRKCSECEAPLWQATPITPARVDAPERVGEDGKVVKAVKARPATNRWPLALYINRRYAGRFALIVDECHQVAAADSDQSRAAQHLATAAIKLLFMTGTFYEGRASSIFHLLYKLDPQFRSLYRYNQASLFVAHHGLLETVFKTESSTSKFGYRRENQGGRTREIPGCSPGMIRLLLNYTVFVRLGDLGYELPPYEERPIEIEHDPTVLEATTEMARKVQKAMREHPQILGAYLQACLGYPDRPDREEEIAIRDDRGWAIEVLATAPALGPGPWPKDLWVLETVQAELREGRKSMVLFTQTDKRDAQPRVAALLEAHGIKVAILRGNISPDKREEWVEKTMAAGVQVLLTNGKLIETGLDLLFAKTIIQYGLEYSTRVLRQATKRSWRLGQTDAVRVYFLAYARTMQAVGLKLVARKMRAAQMLDGDEIGGLAQHDTEGHDFFLELARAAAEEFAGSDLRLAS